MTSVLSNPTQLDTPARGMRQVEQQLIQILAVCAIVLTSLILVIDVWDVLTSDLSTINEPISLVQFGLIAFILGFGGVILLVRQNQVNAARYVLIIALVALVVIVEFFVLSDAAFTVAILALLAVTALGDSRTYVIANLIIIANLGYATIRPLLADPTAAPSGVLLDLLTLAGIALLSLTVRYFANTTRESANVTERTAALLQSSAEIGKITSRLLDRGEMLDQTISLIRDRFGFYHVQVFIVSDEGDQALLVASTGKLGAELLARRHRLAVGSQSVIGQVTLSGKEVIINDTNQSAYHARNDLLPDTRAELALPILDGARIIGALDVQSTSSNAFQHADVLALQIIADLLATSIQNSQLFSAQTETAEENRRLLSESETALREIERLNRQLTRSGWDNYLQEPQATLGLTLAKGVLHAENNWTATLQQAGSNRQSVIRVVNGKQIFAVPVILRGEVIGAIEVEADEPLNANDAVEIMQAVSQRLAISLDNARLFEEAQQATTQEQQINAVVTHFQEATTVDELLQVALTELSETLGAERSAIRLSQANTDQQDTANGGNHA